MRQVHRAGEKGFVDYAGQKPRLTDPTTGEVRPVELFVAVLGASNYTYAEATLTQQLPAGSAAISAPWPSSAASPAPSSPTSSRAASPCPAATSPACSGPMPIMWWPSLCCGAGAVAGKVLCVVALTSHK
jgi:hypothetical protein